VTSETRTTIEASDIKAIEIRCSNCGLRTIWQLKEWNDGFQKCAHCGSPWPIHKSQSYQAMSKAIGGIRELASVKDDKEIPFTIRFEIAGVSDRVSSGKD
jgi:hypothetical protein